MSNPEKIPTPAPTDTEPGGASAASSCSAFSDGHRIGYEAGIKAGLAAFGGGNEIAAIRLPFPAGDAGQIMKLIGRRHKMATMRQLGEWMVFYLPNS